MKRQRGVALLAAVLAIALAVVLVAALLARGEESRARTRNALRAEQTWQLMRGLETWAAAALREDAANGEGIDSPGERWSQPLPPLEIPGGRIAGRMREQNGCFNVNALHPADGEDAAAIARFERLLLALKLDPQIAAAAADWIDADGQERPGGAEDLSYQQRRPAYRAANRPFVHVSELRLLAGVDDEAYRALAPHVCALPAETPINLNFASVPLWMSLDTRITESIARRLWRDGAARHASVEAVRDELTTALGGPPDPRALAGCTTSSEYFVVEAELRVEDVPYLYSTLLRRTPAGVEVVARVRGTW